MRRLICALMIALTLSCGEKKPGPKPVEIVRIVIVQRGIVGYYVIGRRIDTEKMRTFRADLGSMHDTLLHDWNDGYDRLEEVRHD